DHLLNGREYFNIDNVIVSDAVADFFCGFCEFRPDLTETLQRKFNENSPASVKDALFKLIYGLVRRNNEYLTLLGTPVLIESIDLSDFDFSGLSLNNACFKDCIALGTDFRKSDIRGAKFIDCILEQVTLDGAIITGCDFSNSEILSLFVYDEFDKKTSAIITENDARQWLFTKGAKVRDQSDLNPLMGQPWYDAAREVTKTIERRIAGSHQDVSLAKGTKSEQREFAVAFVEYLKKKKILVSVTKSKKGPGDVVKLDPIFRNDIVGFSKHGKISDHLAPFFRKFIPEEFRKHEDVYFKRGVSVDT
ncbi:MAG: Pentapeptide repeat (9 copies), partial [Firmicutes bacterium]|nr:Pentapeptide repeat (9 copies) [Bacillota bacterium]